MGFTYNGQDITAVNYNGQQVKEVKYNGQTVWSAVKTYKAVVNIESPLLDITKPGTLSVSTNIRWEGDIPTGTEALLINYIGNNKVFTERLDKDTSSESNNWGFGYVQDIPASGGISVAIYIIDSKGDTIKVKDLTIYPIAGRNTYDNVFEIA